MGRAAPWIPAAFAILLYAPMPLLLDEVDACYYVERASGIAAGEIRQEFNRFDWYVRDPKAYRTGLILPLAGLIALFGHGAFAYRLLPVLHAAGVAAIVGHLAARQWGRRFGVFLGCLVVPIPILLVQTLRPGPGPALVFWLAAAYACLEHARSAAGPDLPRRWLAAAGLCWGAAYLHHEIAVGFGMVLLPELSPSCSDGVLERGERLHRGARRAAWIAAGLLPCLVFEWVLLGTTTGDPLIRGHPVHGDLLPSERQASLPEATIGTAYWERTLHGAHTSLVLPDGAVRTRYGGVFLLALCGAVWPARGAGMRVGRWVWWIVGYVLFLDYMPDRPFHHAWVDVRPVIPVDGRHLAAFLLPAVLLCGRLLHGFAVRRRVLLAAASSFLALPWLWGDVAWIWDGLAKWNGIPQLAGVLLRDPGRVVYTGDRAAGMLRVHLLRDAPDSRAIAAVSGRIRDYSDLLRERPLEAVVFHHFPSLWDRRERYGQPLFPAEIAVHYGDGELEARYLFRRRPSLTGLLGSRAGRTPPPEEDPLRSELWRFRRREP